MLLHIGHIIYYITICCVLFELIIMEKTELFGKNCHIFRHLNLIGKKWVVFVLLLFLKKNEIKFNEIKNELKPITSKTLSCVLSSLIEEKIILKKVLYVKNNEITSYKITTKGKDLLKIVLELRDFGLKYRICEFRPDCFRCRVEDK